MARRPSIPSSEEIVREAAREIGVADLPPADVRLAFNGRDAASGRYITHPRTGEKMTIAITSALTKTSIQNNVRVNLNGIIEIRNHATHLGVLKGEAREQVLKFGAASVQNFITLYYAWFKEMITVPYLLPIAFVGEANLVSLGYPKSQKELIKALASISSDADPSDTAYSVTLSIDIKLNPMFSGGATVGVTSDPSAPKLQISDDEFVQNFSETYRGIVVECKRRYPNFKADARFRSVMKSIKSDQVCAHERKLDPRSNQPGRWFYNRNETLRILDVEYNS